MSNTFLNDDLGERVVELFRSGRPVCFFVGDENARYVRTIRNAFARYNKQRAERNPDAVPAKVLVHDRWCGFRNGLPDVNMPKDKSNVLASAMQSLLKSKEELQAEGQLDKLAFDPADDIVAIFESVDEELKSQQLLVTLVRNVVQYNMASGTYAQDLGNERNQQLTRGCRMIIFLSPCADVPPSLPELKPEILALPNHTELKKIIIDVVGSQFDRYKKTKGKEGLEPLSDPVMDQLGESLAGLSAQDAEETIALAVIKCGNFEDMDAIFSIVEREKTKALEKIPGVRVIPRSDTVDHCPAGYELLDAYLEKRMGISVDKANEHGVNRRCCVAIGGGPGGGKTEAAKYIGRKMGRINLIWSPGDSKDSLMGSSQKNARRVIQAGRAMHANVIIDDIDKGGMSGAAKNYGGDGGTTGDQSNAVLQELSDPTSPANYTITFNRVPDLPELLRPGRMDKRFYVERPNGATRLAILKDHINRVNLKVGDKKRLEELAMTHTADWTGAELAHVLVKEEAIEVLAEDGDTMNLERMIDATKDFVPMIRQKAFKADIEAMEEACSQFTRIGNIPGTEEGGKKIGSGRSGRSLSV